MDRRYADRNIVNNVSDAWQKNYHAAKNETERLTLEELEEMDLDKLSPYQLELLSTRLLYTARQEEAEETSGYDASKDGILHHHQWRNRRRVEIPVGEVLIGANETDALDDGSASKTKNPGQVKMFNRSSPDGRKTRNRVERTQLGKSYYR